MSLRIGFIRRKHLCAVTSKSPKKKTVAKATVVFYLSIKGIILQKSPSIIVHELLSFSVMGGEIS